MTATVEKSIDVDVPVHTAYNQWTQFETFPEFMEGVVEVKQLSDTTLHWKAKVAGKEKEWDADHHRAAAGPAHRVEGRRRRAQRRRGHLPPHQ